jgi:patatin-like phospholipase/acyl hydrolase
MKRILSIDGGGIRGIIPATILSQIEKRTRKSISSLFDLIAGTSTGGILGLALCRPDANGKPKYTAEALIDLYAQRGREIFSRSFWRGVSSVGGLAEEKYSHRPIEKIFDDYFETDRLGKALTSILVSSYDIENRKPFFFKSWRKETRSVEMRSVARATSAAPTYFEPARVKIRGRTLALVDGGVFANNPAVCAYAEARRLFPAEASFLVVSLGTGELTRPIPYEDAKKWGLAEWALPILSVVFDGVSDAVDYQLNHILGKAFYRFQTDLVIASDDMDNASKANIEALKTEANRILAQRNGDLERLSNLLAEFVQ